MDSDTCVEFNNKDSVGDKKSASTKSSITNNIDITKPGYRKNEFGGYTWSLDWLCAPDFCRSVHIIEFYIFLYFY